MGLNMIKVIENMFYFKNSGTNEISYKTCIFFRCSQTHRNPRELNENLVKISYPKIYQKCIIFQYAL